MHFKDQNVCVFILLLRFDIQLASEHVRAKKESTMTYILY